MSIIDMINQLIRKIVLALPYFIIICIDDCEGCYLYFFFVFALPLHENFIIFWQNYPSLENSF